MTTPWGRGGRTARPADPEPDRSANLERVAGVNRRTTEQLGDFLRATGRISTELFGGFLPATGRFSTELFGGFLRATGRFSTELFGGFGVRARR
jgi:hypothetical protein